MVLERMHLIGHCRHQQKLICRHKVSRPDTITMLNEMMVNIATRRIWFASVVIVIALNAIFPTYTRIFSIDHTDLPYLKAVHPRNIRPLLSNDIHPTELAWSEWCCTGLVHRHCYWSGNDHHSILKIRTRIQQMRIITISIQKKNLGTGVYERVWWSHIQFAGSESHFDLFNFFFLSNIDFHSISILN